MSNNVIIRGFNALGKLIGRGYSRFSRAGVKVCMKLSDEPFICMKLSDEPVVCMKVSVE